MEHSQWEGKTVGTTWMHHTLIRSFRYLNLRFVYAGMAVFVVPFYMLFAHRGYISMYHFFRQRMGYGPLKAFRYVYLNHCKFGQIILDRFAVYAGKHFDFDIENYDLFLELSGKKEGFVILSCHVGNYEIAGYAFKAKEKRYNALVFSGEAATVMENRNRLLSENNIRMIPVKEDMSHLFLMNNALSDGEILSIPGDRIFGSPRSVMCELLGQQAKFPLGPYAFAVSHETTVLAIFVMKESTYRYHVYIRPLDTTVVQQKGSRQEKAAHLAQLFADEVGEIVRKYPTQWFNYYEFWNNDEI